MEIIRVFKGKTDEQRRKNLTEAVIKLENDNQTRTAHTNTPYAFNNVVNAVNRVDFSQNM